MDFWLIIDAARSYLPVATAKMLVPDVAHLFNGARGESLADVAPYLCQCDLCGNVAELVIVPYDKGEHGVLFEANGTRKEIEKHLRQFLMVRRQGEKRPVYFRYYDPRVLRAFLPACNSNELRAFFGPIQAFHCQSDNPEQILSMRLKDGTLTTTISHWTEFLKETFPARKSAFDLTESIFAAISKSKLANKG